MTSYAVTEVWGFEAARGIPSAIFRVVAGDDHATGGRPVRAGMPPGRPRRGQGRVGADRRPARRLVCGARLHRRAWGRGAAHTGPAEPRTGVSLRPPEPTA